MKKAATGVLLIIVLLLLSSITLLANVPRVQLDGEYVDVSPIIIEGRTLMPARDVVEMLGGEVDWCGDLRLVTIWHGDTTVLLTIDNPVATIDDIETTLDVPPQIVNDRTKIPLRFVAEALGVDVDFRDGTVFITTIIPQLTSCGVHKDENMNVVTPLYEMDSGVVFWGHTGIRVHIDPGCSSFQNGVLFGSLQDARNAGRYEWCTLCSFEYRGEDGFYGDEKFLRDGNPNVR